MYHISLLGEISPATRGILLKTIEEMIRPFGLKLGEDLAVLDAAAVINRDFKDAFVAVYFSRGDNPTDPDALEYIVGRNGSPQRSWNVLGCYRISVESSSATGATRPPARRCNSMKS